MERFYKKLGFYEFLQFQIKNFTAALVLVMENRRSIWGHFDKLIKNNGKINEEIIII